MTEAAPAPAPAPAPVAPVSDDWRAALPEDIRSEPSLKDIKDLTGLAKGYVHAQKLVGMDRSKLLAVPGEDAPEDAWNEFYDKIGRPKAPTDYRLPVEEVKFENGVQRSEAAEKWLQETAHKYGLTPKQAAGMYKDYMGFVGQSVGESTKQV